MREGLSTADPDPAAEAAKADSAIAAKTSATSRKGLILRRTSLLSLTAQSIFDPISKWAAPVAFRPQSASYTGNHNDRCRLVAEYLLVVSGEQILHSPTSTSPPEASNEAVALENAPNS